MSKEICLIIFMTFGDNLKLLSQCLSTSSPRTQMSGWVRVTYRYGKGSRANLRPRVQPQRVVVPSDYDYAFASLLWSFNNSKWCAEFYKTFASLLSAFTRKKNTIPGVTKKHMAKWLVLKWSGEDVVKFLNINKSLEALWDICKKTPWKKMVESITSTKWRKNWQLHDLLAMKSHSKNK